MTLHLRLECSGNFKLPEKKQRVGRMEVLCSHAQEMLRLSIEPASQWTLSSFQKEKKKEIKGLSKGFTGHLVIHLISCRDLLNHSIREIDMSRGFGKTHWKQEGRQ